MQKILIVEDEDSIAKLIEVTLSMGNYSCDACNNGLDVLNMVQKQKYDLILLDVMLPGMDGFTVMEKIKAMNIPVIFITAKQDVTDRVKGLKLGAEDYILKPFDPMELLARVEVVFRRFQAGSDDTLSYKNIEINTNMHQVKIDGMTKSLTPKEFDLFVYFVKHQEIVVRKERLLSEIWGYDFQGETRTVDTHIQQIRKKLGLQQELLTIPKVGYCLKKVEN
ncbi:MAG: response regulator transcription factor [Lachnospiraceae bacterium]|jgi:DNA-binding response OmpR family regulator|nr:response regulator transcription factor [Lachnospiraceae bacterium]